MGWVAALREAAANFENEFVHQAERVALPKASSDGSLISLVFVSVYKCKSMASSVDTQRAPVGLGCAHLHKSGAALLGAIVASGA